MQLGIKLAAIGLILLAAKTHHSVSAYLSDTQVASERPALGLVAVAAEVKQPKSPTCPEKPGNDAVAVHSI
jgi:hypothetical protein